MRSKHMYEDPAPGRFPAPVAQLRPVVRADRRSGAGGETRIGTDIRHEPGDDLDRRPAVRVPEEHVVVARRPYSDVGGFGESLAATGVHVTTMWHVGDEFVDAVRAGGVVDDHDRDVRGEPGQHPFELISAVIADDHELERPCLLTAGVGCRY